MGLSAYIVYNRPHETRGSLRKTIAWQRMRELESEMTGTKHTSKETKEQLLRYKLFTSLKRKASLLKTKYRKFILCVTKICSYGLTDLHIV